MPSLKAFKKGKNIVLTTEDSTISNIWKGVKRMMACVYLTAKIIRKGLFGSNSLFNENFDYSSQESYVPKNLLVLLRMVLEGTNINSESFYATNPAALSLAQLNKFTSVKRKHRERTIRPRQTLSQEIPLLVYLELMIHSKTRMKGVIEKLAALGLSFNYNRVNETQEEVMKQEIKSFDEMGLVCRKNLLTNVSITAAIDNIVHNSTSSTASSTFYR